MAEFATFKVESSLPQDSCVFQWDRDAVVARYDSSRIVRYRPIRRYSSVVNVAARRSGQLANAFHLLSYRIAVVHASWRKSPVARHLDQGPQDRPELQIRAVFRQSQPSLRRSVA